MKNLPYLFEMKNLQIKKEEFISFAINNTRNKTAKYFKIADLTAQRIADELNVKFKKFKPTGRKKIKLI
jgi:hypothetical protein